LSLRRICLAALLGVLIGFGIASLPSPQIATQSNALLAEKSQQSERNFEATTDTNSSESRLALGAMAIGLLLATPFFFIAKRRMT